MFDGSYPIADMLQLMGRASRPGASSGTCVILCHSARFDTAFRFVSFRFVSFRFVLSAAVPCNVVLGFVTPNLLSLQKGLLQAVLVRPAAC